MQSATLIAYSLIAAASVISPGPATMPWLNRLVGSIFVAFGLALLRL